MHCFNLVKDQEQALPPSMRRALIGCGWDPTESGSDFDLDVACLLLDDRGRLISNDGFVYFRQLRYGNDLVVHTGDSLTGEGEGDDERLLIDLWNMPGSVARIVVICCIYDAAKRRQTFGMISRAFLRVVDISGEADTARNGPLYRADSYAGEEFCRFAVNDQASLADGIVFGELCRERGGWAFRASGREIHGGFSAFLKEHAVAEGLALTRALPAWTQDPLGTLARQPLVQRVAQRKFPLLCLLCLAFVSSVGVVPLCVAAGLCLVLFGS